MCKLSVIVPVYNVEKYIHHCVDSLLSQDFQEMEILLIDDESPDSCPQICEAYAKKDNRVRVIHQRNQGLAETRNVGVREARGEYIAFLDSDDFLLPGVFSKVMPYFDSDAQVDMVVYDYCTFYDDADDRLLLHHQGINAGWSVEKIRDEFLKDRYPSYMWNKIYRKSLFEIDGEQIKILKGISFEDMYIMGTLVARARKIAYVPEAFVCYRLHASSFSMTPKVKKKYGLYMAWREREKVCKIYGCTEPLSYVRERAEKAAISLKIIDLAAKCLSKDETAELDDYIKTIHHDTSRLPWKHKFELWAFRHLPIEICAFLGKMSILTEERKQKKLQKQ